MKRFIVKFKDHSELIKEKDSKSRNAEKRKEAKARIEKHRKDKLEKKVNRFLSKGEEFDVVVMDEELAKELAKDDSIEYIEESIAFEADIQYVDASHQYSGVSTFKNKHGATGNGVTVAVLDSGLDYTHQDFNTSKISGIKFNGETGGYQSSRLEDCMDYQGHGTSVAGIISMQNNTNGYLGVAPNANLIVIKGTISDTDPNNMGRMQSQTMANAINYLINNKIKVDFINISYSQTSFSQVVADACARAYNNGIIVVTSAGNNGGDTPDSDKISYLSNKRERVNQWKNYPNVIVVGAVEKDSNGVICRADYSAFGEGLDITAPSGIYTAVSKNASQGKLPNTYAIAKGTSISAPFVVGSLAVIKEYLGRSNVETSEILMDLYTDKIGSKKYFSNNGILKLDPLTDYNTCYSVETFSLAGDKGIAVIDVKGQTSTNIMFSGSYMLSEAKISVYASGGFHMANANLSVKGNGTLLKNNSFINNWYNKQGGTSVVEEYSEATYVGEFHLKNTTQNINVSTSADLGRVSRIWIVVEGVYDDNLWSPIN